MNELEQRVAAFVAMREEMARERARADLELREIAAAVKGTREVTKVAGLLGLSRQRLYQLAA